MQRAHGSDRAQSPSRRSAGTSGSQRARCHLYTAKVITDAEIADMYAFVQSRPEPAKDIPLLKP